MTAIAALSRKQRVIATPAALPAFLWSPAPRLLDINEVAPTAVPEATAMNDNTSGKVTLMAAGAVGPRRPTKTASTRL
jgi:hypothetical protein